MKKLLFTATLLATTLTFADSGCYDKSLKSVIKEGDKASKALLKTLGGELKKHIKKEGLVEAASFCSTEAFPLTEKVNKKLPKGVTIKRVSLKERNPANKPSWDETNILKSMETLQGEGVVLPNYMIEKVDGGYKYYKPLIINNEVCLKCHGDLSNNPSLATFMKEHYPQDMATGYQMGDLRGAIVVEIKR